MSSTSFGHFEVVGDDAITPNAKAHSRLILSCLVVGAVSVCCLLQQPRQWDLQPCPREASLLPHPALHREGLCLTLESTQTRAASAAGDDVLSCLTAPESRRGAANPKCLLGRVLGGWEAAPFRMGAVTRLCWDPGPERFFSSWLLISAQTSYTLVQLGLKTPELSQAEEFDRTV